jgi:hypothetical protein
MVGLNLSRYIRHESVEIHPGWQSKLYIGYPRYDRPPEVDNGIASNFYLYLDDRLNRAFAIVDNLTALAEMNAKNQASKLQPLIF